MAKLNIKASLVRNKRLRSDVSASEAEVARPVAVVDQEPAPVVKKEPEPAPVVEKEPEPVAEVKPAHAPVHHGKTHKGNEQEKKSDK